MVCVLRVFTKWDTKAISDCVDGHCPLVTDVTKLSMHNVVFCCILFINLMMYLPVATICNPIHFVSRVCVRKCIGNRFSGDIAHAHTCQPHNCQHLTQTQTHTRAWCSHYYLTWPHARKPISFHMNALRYVRPVYGMWMRKWCVNGIWWILT